MRRQVWLTRSSWPCEEDGKGIAHSGLEQSRGRVRSDHAVQGESTDDLEQGSEAPVITFIFPT